MLLLLTSLKSLPDLGVDATRRFDSVVNGTQSPQSVLRAAQEGLVHLVGQEDVESYDSGRLQGALFQICGKHNLGKLRHRLVEEMRWDSMTRMKELRDPHVT